MLEMNTIITLKTTLEINTLIITTPKTTTDRNCTGQNERMLKLALKRRRVQILAS